MPEESQAPTPMPQAAELFSPSEWELRDFFENAAVGLHWVAADGTVLWANKAELDLLGYTAEEYIGHHIAEFHTDDAAIQDILQRLSANETLHSYEARLKSKDGSIRHVLISSNVLWKDGKFLHTRCFTRDITERKQAEEEIKRLNQQLQRAMAETHHRIKNNLQILTALIDMQDLEEEETIAASELIRLKQHIRTLATLHDLLTQSAKEHPGTDYISVESALNILLPLLEGTSKGRRIRFDVAPLRLPVRMGTSLSILINELVSNAVKHGKGTIDLTLSTREGTVHLSVCDEGAGFPDGFDPVADAHTGMELVENIGRMDLRGQLFCTNRPEGGACVRVSFPVPEQEATGASPVACQ